MAYNEVRFRKEENRAAARFFGMRRSTQRLIGLFQFENPMQTSGHAPIPRHWQEKGEAQIKAGLSECEPSGEDSHVPYEEKPIRQKFFLPVHTLLPMVQELS